MAKCPYCGKEMPENEKFCVHCGSEIPNTSAQQTPPPGADDSRFYQGSFPSLFGLPATEFSGYAKWTADEIHEMPPSQTAAMLDEIKETAQRRVHIVTTAADLKEKCDQLAARKNASWKSVDVFKCLSIGFVILFFLVLIISSINGAAGTALILIPPIIVFLILFANGSSRKKAAIKEYDEKYPQLNSALNQAIMNMRLDAVNHGDDYISAMIALPSYWSDAAALDYLIDVMQNHRARTLGDAINLFEKDKNDKQLQNIMYQQLVAQRETAYNSQIAAQAAKSIARSAKVSAVANVVSAVANVGTARNTKRVANSAKDIAEDTWAMRKGLD